MTTCVCSVVFAYLAFKLLINSNHVPHHAYLLVTISPLERSSSRVMSHLMCLSSYTDWSPPLILHPMISCLNDISPNLHQILHPTSNPTTTPTDPLLPTISLRLDLPLCLWHPPLHSPHEAPPPPSTQHMHTISRSGIVKPIDCLNLPSTSISSVLRSHIQTFKDPHWHKAMNEEYHALITNDTWVLVPRPPREYVVHFMWLFKQTFNVDGSLSRYKVQKCN